MTNNGKIGITEGKSSPTAPLTPKQKTAFPQIELNGGIIRGNKASGIGLPSGTQIPPTSVEIKRPN